MLTTLIAFYFLIGIIYCIVNGGIRKLDTEGDFLLPFSWIIFWPPFIIALIVHLLTKLLNKGKRL